MGAAEVMRRPKTLLAVTALAAGAAAIEGLALSQNITHAVPPHSCASPVAESFSAWVDPLTSNEWQTQTGLFTSGVLIQGTAPRSAVGVQATWRHVGDSDAAWKTDASPMVAVDASGKFAIKMAIGNGPVEFGVFDDAATCASAPQATFTHETTTQYFLAKGDLPYGSFLGISQVVELF